MWNAGSGTTQTLSVNDPGSWNVVANSQPPGSTGVQTYPDTQEIYTRSDNTPDPLSGFSSIISSFSESMGGGDGTSAEAAYDIWLGQNSSTNYANEVMIWNDMVTGVPAAGPRCWPTPPSADPAASRSRTGRCASGASTELIWYLTSDNEHSGTVDVLSMLTWLESHGYLPVNSGLNQIRLRVRDLLHPRPDDVHRQPAWHHLHLQVRGLLLEGGPRIWFQVVKESKTVKNLLAERVQQLRSFGAIRCPPALSHHLPEPDHHQAVHLEYCAAGKSA